MGNVRNGSSLGCDPQIDTTLRSSNPQEVNHDMSTELQNQAQQKAQGAVKVSTVEVNGNEEKERGIEEETHSAAGNLF
ncbi:hypothetical protein S40288_10658 [Stachybotrys chartarum IBT 40288]|nr:hypothetical protein S40288_10658 [Stachybotrys chartarum IBT 40288]